MVICLFLCVLPAVSGAADTSYQGDGASLHGPGNNKCADNGGDGKTVFIIPRVYISYIGKNNCWSEIRHVEIPIDFMELRDAAQAKGDKYVPDGMSFDILVDFFTWLLESGRYAMPGDALFGVLGYVQRNDYAGLYELYGPFNESRRLNKSR